MDHYHTQHAPFGAFASFTCGLPGAPGGFGQSLAGPADQNLYVAHRVAEGAWQQLPFLGAEAANGALAYLGDNPAAFEAQRVETVAPGEYVRELGWASDTWRHGAFSFSLYSPWDQTGDPSSMPPDAARFAFAPVVCGEIAYDNRNGTAPVELFFGVHNPAQNWRVVADADGDADARLVGCAAGRAFGFATVPSPEVFLHQGFDPYQMRLRGHRDVHLLGHVAGFRLVVPAGERRAFPLALGFFRDGFVTTGIEARYYYTSLFVDLDEVLGHGLARHADYKALAAKRDAELAASRLDADQRWLLAQATHSYLGSTQLLIAEEEGVEKPLWVVNEGEYRMLNTFDLTVDHLFFELEWHPWAVRDTLDLFVRRYSFTDGLRSADGRRAEGGLSFTHDQGVCDQFTPPGVSSYEVRGLHGCFSQMTMEQLLNWICCAVTYAEFTGDRAWLRDRLGTLDACAESLRRRDDPEPRRRDGLLKWDSDRCDGGSEITTYDSLDVSLGQARNNLYIASKALSAWLLLEQAYASSGLGEKAGEARASADLAARAILGKFETETGFFPAVFEAGNRSRILPAVEGLVFPLFLGWAARVEARYPALFAAYGRHLKQALQPGVCLDGESGAWKISSTSTNTWYSKIALAQHVARMLFPDAVGPEARRADAVHARFQRSAPLGRFAMVDQVRSTDGGDLGSRYYPRVVTAALWLREGAGAGRPFGAG